MSLDDGVLSIETDVASLTAALVDLASVSGNEATIADAVESALGDLGYLDVERDGNVVLARTNTGRSQRIRDGRAPRHGADCRQRAVAT